MPTPNTQAVKLHTVPLGGVVSFAPPANYPDTVTWYRIVEAGLAGLGVGAIHLRLLGRGQDDLTRSPAWGTLRGDNYAFRDSLCWLHPDYQPMVLVLCADEEEEGEGSNG